MANRKGPSRNALRYLNHRARDLQRRGLDRRAALARAARDANEKGYRL